LLLSGLLESQVDEVVAAFTPALRFAAPTVEHGWVCLQGTAS
jgi:ribosomal protein L11 methylase PrmA